MKTRLTQKDLISLTNQHGLFINPRTTKSAIMSVVDRVISGEQHINERWVKFTNDVISITRDNKLKRLGL